MKSAVNFEKLKSLIKEQGVSQTFICSRLNKHRSFLLDVYNHRSSLKPEQIEVIAEILHTTSEYLTDQTEEKGIKKETASNDDLNARFVKLFMRLSPEEQEREIAFLESKVASQDK